MANTKILVVDTSQYTYLEVLVNTEQVAQYLNDPDHPHRRSDQDADIDCARRS